MWIKLGDDDAEVFHMFFLLLLDDMTLVFQIDFHNSSMSNIRYHNKISESTYSCSTDIQYRRFDDVNRFGKMP